jgi:hypothetical protein
LRFGPHRAAKGVLRLQGIIDPDDCTTWPDEVLQWARDCAARSEGSTEFTSDLNSELIEREDEFQTLFATRRVLVYHCTRLLPHEVDGIREHGLQPLSKELVVERIERAYELGALGAVEVTRLKEANVFAVDNTAGRVGQVCFVMGRAAFDDSVGGCDPLLSMWGGEAIYWGLADGPDPPLLGLPAIVVARTEVNAADRKPLVFPSLAKLFVGALLGTEGQYADVFVRAPVPPEDIIDVWQPGNGEYDRHPRLPRT